MATVLVSDTGSLFVRMEKRAEEETFAKPQHDRPNAPYTTNTSKRRNLCSGGNDCWDVAFFCLWRLVELCCTQFVWRDQNLNVQHVLCGGCKVDILCCNRCMVETVEVVLHTVCGGSS